ncbi:MAG: FAD-binding oxidoreductase, partial [Ignavibacteriaceae bacterium]|nr:FAD-binding oxidoreductase [Ignavibacteriaceae bacterium]
MKWWGWGNPEETYNLEDRPNAWSYLEQKLGLDGRKCSVINLDEIELPASHLPQPYLNQLINLCGQENIEIDKVSRLTHSLGLSYGDLIRRRQGKIHNPVDIVVYPENEIQIQEIFKLAHESQLAIIPYGGGTTVTGSLEMRTLPPYQGIVSLDLKRMNSVQIDDISLTATAEAGILGPALEAEVNRHGFTLGHFPQSFEYSTLGGWLATRSAGQNSTKYGKIEHMLISLRVVTPSGILETKTVPASAAGPDLNQIFSGSEGTLGIITKATLKLHLLPESVGSRGVLFKDFHSGILAIKEIMQSGITPSVLRLSDETETEAIFMLRSRSRNNLKNMAERAIFWLLDKLGHSFMNGALLLLIFEGTPGQVNLERKISMKICRKYGGVSLGSSPGQSWLKERFKQPY